MIKKNEMDVGNIVFELNSSSKWQIVMFYIVQELSRIGHISATQPDTQLWCDLDPLFQNLKIDYILMVYIKKNQSWIFSNMWLISLDHVMYLIWVIPTNISNKF